MIVTSFVLVLVSLVLLVTGVARGSLGLVIGSIVASLLAFAALYASIRHRSAAAPAVADGPAAGSSLLSAPAGERARQAPAADQSPAAGPAEQATLGGQPPPDEPAEEPTTPGDASRVAALTDEVVVVDGRPRYHLRSCGHLVGRQTIPLPVAAAREAGFSPCARCAPDRALLGRG